MKKYMVIEPFDKAQEPRSRNMVIERSRNKVSSLKSKLNSFIIYTLSFLLLIGCVPGSNVNLTQGSKGSIPGFSLGVQSQKVSAAKHMTRNAQPYTGPIELKFDTALLGDSYQGPRKIIPWKTASSGGFTTQAVPAGPIVFQEQFVRDKNPIKGEKRDFTVSDTSKVYTLHIQNGDAQGNNTVSSAVININGQDWVRPNDFNGSASLTTKGKGTLEVQKDSILLNANNTMTIDVNGSPGSTMIVTVVEGGQAGTIRRKNGPLNEHPDQAAHNAGNDVNIFNPADPGSLGDLLPSTPGNSNSSEPETTQAIVSINGDIPPVVETGKIMIQVAQPIQQNLELILNKYEAEAVPLSEEILPDFFLIKVNMLKINLTNMASQIIGLNQLISESSAIQSVSFGNLESAKTFALIIDLLSNGLVKAAEFNNFSNQQAPFTSSEQFGEEAERSWWLNDISTNVIEAWNYSMGYSHTKNKPVEVAVIDAGFAGMWDLLQSGKDMYDRTLVDKGWIINYASKGSGTSLSFPVQMTGALLQREGTFTCTSDVHPAACSNTKELRDTPHRLINYPTDHGTLVSSTIVAQINNGTGFSGVAPHAKIIPIKLGNGLKRTNAEIISALGLFLSKSSLSDVDVINISLGNAPRAGLNLFFQDTYRSLGGTGSEDVIKDLVNQLNQRNIVTVISAGNGSYNAAKANDYIKAGVNAIFVGNLQLPNGVTSPSGLERSTAGSQTSSDYGSYWGDGVTIWAPGTQLSGYGLRRGADGEPILTGNIIDPPGLMKWTGTSASAPVISGIVALMKAIKEDLNKDTILNILLNTSVDTSTYNDTQLRDVPVADLFAKCEPAYTFGVNCGDFQTKSLTLKVVNAAEALKATAGQFIIGSSRIKEFTGELAIAPGTYQLIPESDPSGRINISYAGISNPLAIDSDLDLQAEDIRSPGVFTPVSSLVGKRVRVDGRKNGNVIHAYQFKRLPFPPPPPAPPATSLDAGSITTNSFIFRWGDVSEATGYDVLKNGAVIKSNLSTTSLLVDGLTPGTTYQMQVRSLRTVGSTTLIGGLTSAKSVTTLSPTPTPPPSCTNPRNVKVTTTNTSNWRYQAGGIGSGPAIFVSNPPFTPAISGAFPIWGDTTACPAPCIIQLLHDFKLNAGEFVKSATVQVQAADNAEISVRGRTVGSVSLAETQNSPKTFTINPDHFGQGENTLLLSFLGFNFFQQNPAIIAKFDINICP